METSRRITNYARFYTLLKQMPDNMDKDDLKAVLVQSATNGRTDSLREMTIEEYERCCKNMANVIGRDAHVEAARNQLRHQRSIVLRLMQKIGVDTTDWNAINAYCLSKKIAGKMFRDIDYDELGELSIKLRMILKKAKTK